MPCLPLPWILRRLLQYLSGIPFISHLFSFSFVFISSGLFFFHLIVFVISIYITLVILSNIILIIFQFSSFLIVLVFWFCAKCFCNVVFCLLCSYLQRIRLLIFVHLIESPYFSKYPLNLPYFCRILSIETKEARMVGIAS